MTTDFHGIVPFPNGHHGRGIGALIASGSTLLNDLVSWWDLDETSGPRADSVGSNDLTDNNTVTYESGKIGNAAKYIAANNEYLTGTPIDITGDWSFSIWANVKEASPIGAPVYLRNWKLSGFVTSMQLAQNAFGTTFRLYVYDEDAANVFAQKTSVGIGWHNFVGVYNSTTRVVTLYVDDDGSPATSGVLPKAIRTESDEMRIGHTFDYAEDLLGIWDRQLTSDEVTELYNLGASIKNTFTDNGEGFREDLLAYYKLEETSGTRENAANPGTYDLTDNNTVTSATGISGTAASFIRASNEYLSYAGGGIGIAAGGARTVVCWAKTSTTLTGGYAALWTDGGAWPNGSALSVYQEAAGTTLRVLLGHDAPSYDFEDFGGLDLDDGEWHLVAGKYDPVTDLVYAGHNGVWSVGQTLAGDVAVSADHFYVNSYQSGGSGAALDAVIDEVMVYSRALSDDEFTALYNAGAGRFYDFNTV
jgi:hypothetical protein